MIVLMTLFIVIIIVSCLYVFIVSSYIFFSTSENEEIIFKTKGLVLLQVCRYLSFFILKMMIKNLKYFVIILTWAYLFNETFFPSFFTQFRPLHAKSMLLHRLYGTVHFKRIFGKKTAISQTLMFVHVGNILNNCQIVQNKRKCYALSQKNWNALKPITDNIRKGLNFLF